MGDFSTKHFFFTLSLPERYFQKQTFIYPARKWENEGQFWQTHFDIKNWAKIIPDGTRILKKGFYKKICSKKEANYLETFILETKRAELTHWLSILPSVLFFYGILYGLDGSWSFMRYYLMYRLFLCNGTIVHVLNECLIARTQDNKIHSFY